MPISRREFEELQGRDQFREELGRAVHEFMASHRDQAFTIQEITEALFGPTYEKLAEGLKMDVSRATREGLLLALTAVGEHLATLEKREAVERREIAGEVYWRLVR